MKRSTEPRARVRAPRRGFTLLEVLAAVAILGIWFSVLASVAIQGQRSEGENERRLRASLLADEVLVDVELGFENGEFPEEPEEIERDEFLVRIEALPITEVDFPELDESLLPLLETALVQVLEDVYVVRVEVSWVEGTSDETVTRLTYGWNAIPFQETLGRLPEDEGAPEEGTEDGLPEDELSEDALPPATRDGPR